MTFIYKQELEVFHLDYIHFSSVRIHLSTCKKIAHESSTVVL